jgi:ketosteroid isomerase-like protein
MTDPADVERLAHRAAISDIVHAYARHIRAGDGAACAALFSEDAVFEVRALADGTRGAGVMRGRFEGRAAILQYLTQGEAAKTSVCPLIHNLLIDIDGREATSNCVMTTLVWPSGKRIVGEYHDRFRLDARWRIASRMFTIFGAFTPAGAAAS